MSNATQIFSPMKSVLSFLFPFVLAAAIAFFPELSHAKADEGFSPDEKEFLTSAAAGNLLEIKLSEMARDKSAQAEVKHFGIMMLEDHGKLNAEVKRLAGKYGVALPTSLSVAQGDVLRTIGGLSGDNLDRAYVAEMVSAHQKDVGAFTKMQSRAKNPDMKRFVELGVPLIKTHLARVEEMQRTYRGEAKPSAASANPPGPQSPPDGGTPATQPGNPPLAPAVPIPSSAPAREPAPTPTPVNSASR